LLYAIGRSFRRSLRLVWWKGNVRIVSTEAQVAEMQAEMGRLKRGIATERGDGGERG